jgi:hypothetical protein
VVSVWNEVPGHHAAGPLLHYRTAAADPVPLIKVDSII